MPKWFAMVKHSDACRDIFSCSKGVCDDSTPNIVAAKAYSAGYGEPAMVAHSQNCTDIFSCTKEACFVSEPDKIVTEDSSNSSLNGD